MITVGCDPEVFLQEPNTGKIIPSTGIVGGSKDDPRIVDCGAFQEDNIMAEINTTPANTEDEFVHNVTRVLQQLRECVAPLELVIEPWVMIDADIVDDAVNLFGCSPDYNVYTGEENPPVDATVAGLMRTASGNIHIGFEQCDDHPSFRGNVIKALDMYLGLPSILFERDGIRRKLYGKAGAYRPTPYGVEYRVLSNFWLTDEKYMRWVYSQVVTVTENWYHRVFDNASPQYVEDIINSHNTQEARAAVNYFEVKLP